MLDKYRNKEGFIDLNNTPYTADISERFKLIIDGVGYYFKYTTPEMLYNELIAEELAKKLKDNEDIVLVENIKDIEIDNANIDDIIVKTYEDYNIWNNI